MPLLGPLSRVGWVFGILLGFTSAIVAQEPVSRRPILTFRTDPPERNQEAEKQTEPEEKTLPPALPANEPEKKAGKAATESTAGDKIFEVGKSLKMEGAWRNGLWFETPDKAFRYSVGGVIQFDMGWYNASQNIVNSIGAFNDFVDPGQGLTDGMGFRRARLRFAGNMYEVIEFFAQYEFAQSLDLRRGTLGITGPTPDTDFEAEATTGFNEVYIGVTQLPVIGNIRVGHHRETLNFATGTPDNNQTFLERPLLVDAFNGFIFSSGVTVQQSYFEERACLWLGFFENNSRDFSAVGDGEYVYDVRLTGLPIWNEEQQLWAHTGVDYSYRNLDRNEVSFRARPPVRTGSSFQVPNILDTDSIFSTEAQQIGNLEFAAACGRLTLSAEGSWSWVTDAYTGGLPLPNGTLPAGARSRGTYLARGAYMEALYFLTPDHRGYRKERPGFDRVVPKENFFLVKGERGLCYGLGAWELGVRYDYLDLTDAGINGGTGQAVTLALNWYFNPNSRIQMNYVVMDRHFDPADTAGRVNGAFQGFGIRFNCDF